MLRYSKKNSICNTLTNTEILNIIAGNLRSNIISSKSEPKDDHHIRRRAVSGTAQTQQV